MQSLAETVSVHPLDPLSADEIKRAVQILSDKHRLDENYWFAEVRLQEPDKAAVSAHVPGGDVSRRVFFVIIDRPGNRTFEALVSLDDGVVLNWEHIEGVQPAIILEEFYETEELVKTDPEFLKAMARRGITDVSMISIDPWSAGSYGADTRDQRRINALMWLRKDSPDDNPYAHPIDGLIAHINLTERTVEVVDLEQVSIPEEPGNYIPELTGQRRADDMRPLHITQPEGPSFSLDGHSLHWYDWSLRIGFTQREGLVLHDVKYSDRGADRSVLYRGSLSSMVVPYGDPSPDPVQKERVRHRRVPHWVSDEFAEAGL